MTPLTYTELKAKATSLGLVFKGNIKREDLEKLIAETLHTRNKEAGEDCSSCPPSPLELSPSVTDSTEPSATVVDSTVNAEVTVDVSPSVIATGVIQPPPPKKKVILTPEPTAEYKSGDMVQDVRTGEKFVVEFVTGAKEIARKINMTDKGLKFYHPSVLRPFTKPKAK